MGMLLLTAVLLPRVTGLEVTAWTKESVVTTAGVPVG